MTPRRVILAAMGSLPFARPDQHYEPPLGGQQIPGTRTGIVRARTVIIFGTGNGAGLFAYSPAPGTGNLVASITGNNVKDLYGNQTTAPLAVYDPSASPVLSAQLAAQGLFWQTAATEAGPYSIIAQVSSDAIGDLTIGGTTIALATGPVFVSHLLNAQGGLVVTASGSDQVALSNALAGGLLLQVTNTTAAPSAPNVRIVSAAAGDPALGLRVSGDTRSRLAADSTGKLQWSDGTAATDAALYRAAAAQLAADYTAYNNAGAAETWQTVGGTGAAFAGTWANAAAPGVPLQYRRNAAPYKSVHWVGRVTNTNAQAAGSAITAAVASAYRPANTHDMTCFNITTGAVVRVSIGSTGVLTCQSAIAANDVVGIPDCSIGLDA